jgi:hypothetical protein
LPLLGLDKWAFVAAANRYGNVEILVGYIR